MTLLLSNKRQIRIIIYLSLATISFSLFLLFAKERYTNFKQKEDYIAKQAFKNEQLKLLKASINRFILYENYYLDENTDILNKDDSSLLLKNIEYNYPILAIYSTGTPCNTCIDKLIQTLRIKLGKSLSSNLAIFINSNTNVHKTTFERLINSKAYTANLNIEGLEPNKNYLFIMHEDLSIHYLFEYSIYLDHDVTENYLEIISEKYELHAMGN